MKSCPNCGNDLRDTVTKCPYCLYSFVTENPTPKPAPTPTPQPTQTPQSAPAAHITPGQTPKTNPSAASAENSFRVSRDENDATLPKPQKKKGKWIVLLGVTVVAVILIRSCSGKGDTASSGQSTNANSNSSTNMHNTSNADSALLDAADEKIADAQTAYDEENYLEGALPKCEEALQNYMSIVETEKMQGELTDRIDAAYALYQATIVQISEGLIAQGPIPGGYEQVAGYLDQAMGMANTLYETGSGYVVDNSEVSDLQSNLVTIYRDLYIQAINNITTYDHWSRDEAWSIADQAYNVANEDGTPALFSLDDQEDPLRMRYVYCLAMVTRKRCETGLADGSMSYADAVQRLSDILAETDYNPLLLQDMINYGQQAGMNVSNYQYAYQMIMSVIQSEEGITIGSDVDLDHFWYFNDLDGDAAYKVGAYGTTSFVRDWIRNNIPEIL